MVMKSKNSSNSEHLVAYYSDTQTCTNMLVFEINNICKKMLTETGSRVRKGTKRQNPHVGVKISS